MNRTAVSESRILIVSSSPAGSTRRVSRIIRDELQRRGNNPLSFDIGIKKQLDALRSELEDLPPGSCIFIGSPVYAFHAVPPIMKLLSRLEKTAGHYAVPFVTWGGVSSGVALHEMAQMLCDRGYQIIGAAKVIAVHSMMWQSISPLGEEHPNAEDEALIKDLAKRMAEKLTQGHCDCISLEELNDQPDDARKLMEEYTLKAAKKVLPPRRLKMNQCTFCAVCMELCPARAIRLTPYPTISSECFFCFNCVRHCPEGALSADLSQVEERIRDRAEKYAERPLSQVFV